MELHAASLLGRHFDLSAIAGIKAKKQKVV